MKIELNALIKEWASYNINLRNLSENSVKAYSLDLKDFLYFSFHDASTSHISFSAVFSRFSTVFPSSLEDASFFLKIL